MTTYAVRCSLSCLFTVKHPTPQRVQLHSSILPLLMSSPPMWTLDYWALITDASTHAQRLSRRHFLPRAPDCSLCNTPHYLWSEHIWGYKDNLLVYDLQHDYFIIGSISTWHHTEAFLWKHVENSIISLYNTTCCSTESLILVVNFEHKGW